MIPGRRFIAWASQLVPFLRRREWQREWEAEAAHAWSRLTRDGRPSRFAVWRLRIRIWTCIVDALWEKKETMTMKGFLIDIRHAVRSLARRPAFAGIAIVTLALGIGANAAVFTLVDGVLLSPLPFAQSEDLIAIEHQGREGRDALPISQGLFLLYGDEANSIESIAMHVGSTVTLVPPDGEPERVRVRAATPEFFDVLRIAPALGRGFVAAEGAPDGELVVVLSHEMWQNRFGGDPGVLGRSLDINGRLRQVVGVMPRDFSFPDQDARIWLPLVVDPNGAPLAAFGPSGIARVAEGHNIEGVQNELEGLIARLPQLFPESGAVSFLQEVGLKAEVSPLKEVVVGDLGQTLWILLGMVGFVLLIACANVANLLLVRAESRQRELALRVAVGAGRWQVLRSFMSESAVLAGVGAVLGLFIASVAVSASLGYVPTSLPRLAEIGVDARVIGFTSAVGVGCALFFGLFPMIRYGGEDLAGQLREADGRTEGRQGNRLRSALVVAQMALALVLLIGAGLMARSFQELRAVDPGFDASGVLTARVTVPAAEMEGWEATAGFFRQLRQRLADQSGIEAVGFAQSVPLGNGLGYFSVEVEDHPRAEGELPVFASNNQVEEGYLEAVSIDLLEGRTFRAGDGAEGARSVVVARAFAEHWWPGQSALGRRMRLGYPEEDWYTIVGVVADVHYQSLDEPPEEMVYWPATVGQAESPQPTRGMDVAIKVASGDPLQFVPVLRREVQELNPRIPVSTPRPLDELLSESTARYSFTIALLGAASGIALLLGLIGIYGVISYVVSQRTREIGVRMALGATSPSVRSMVVRQGMVLAGIGVVVGLIAAGALSRVMSSQLYGVSATDPATYGAVALGLVGVALVACWIPAMRAAGVNPSSALRAD